MATKERLVVYIMPALREQIADAIEASGQAQQEWLRDALAAALHPDDTRPQDDGTLALRLEAALKDNARLEDSLRDARQSKDRLEVLLAQSQDTVSRMTLALPAAGETSAGPSWWRFWQRAESVS